MDNDNYEQYELTAEQVGDTWKYLKESMVCSMVLYNGNADHRHAAEPRGPEDRVLRAGRPRQHGHERDKPCKVETGAEFQCPVFVNIGDLIKIDTRTGEYLERAKE